MPSFTRPITELPEHVFFPITRQLSKRILSYLSYEDVIGDNIYINTDWSSSSTQFDKNHNAKIDQNVFKVEVNLQMNPSSQKWDVFTFKHTTAPNGYGDRFLNESTPIYLDDKNKVFIYETCSPVTIAMNCELFLQSADLAFQTPQQIFNGHGNGDTMHLQDLFFSYPIPKHILYILHGLWEMDRTEGKNAGIPFLAYLKQRSNDMWQIEQNRETGQAQIVLPVYNLEALTTLEYSDDRPQAQMQEKLPVSFSIPFIYTVQFAMPTLNIIRYPVVYDNQLVPMSLIPSGNYAKNNRIAPAYRNKSENYYTNKVDPKNYPAVVIPEYDEWTPPISADFYKTDMHPVLIQSTILDDENSTVAKEDLKLIGGDKYPLKTITKEILYQQGSDSFNNDSIFCVRVYNDDKEVNKRDLSIDDDLILTWNHSIKRSRFRIVIAVAGYWKHINPKYWKLLAILFPYLPSHLKNQIIKEFTIDGSPWKDNKFSKDIRIGTDGWVYDTRLVPRRTTLPKDEGNPKIYPNSKSYDRSENGVPVIPIINLNNVINTVSGNKLHDYYNQGGMNGINPTRIAEFGLITKHR